uniref:Uncharacterized protein n=1 Tax=Salmo trutta TaxID=8032 RepID=A0A673Y3L9_SALTR
MQSDYGLAHDLENTIQQQHSKHLPGYCAGGTIQQQQPKQLPEFYQWHMLSKTSHQQNPCLLSLPKGSLYHAHDVIKRPTIYCAEHCSSLPDLFPWMKLQATGERRGRQTEENKKDTFPVNMLDQNELEKQSKETDNKIMTSDEEGKG